MQDTSNVEIDWSHTYFEYKYTGLKIDTTISHFQLRHTVAVSAADSIYFTGPSGRAVGDRPLRPFA